MKIFYLLVFLVLAFGYLCAQDTIIQLKPVEISTSKSEIVRLAPHYELINLEEIQLQTMSKEMPAILSQLPGIHYVPGRGIGDTELRIRGFDVSNIQLLINDIPESFVDEGWTYWSNFTGIEDFTQSVFCHQRSQQYASIQQSGRNNFYSSARSLSCQIYALFFKLQPVIGQ